MNLTEVSVFIIYLVFMLSIGVYFFLRDKQQTEKGFGRQKDGPVGSCTISRSVGHECVGVNGTAHINIRLRTWPDLDSCRTSTRLFSELDI